MMTKAPFGVLGTTIKLRSGIYYDLQNPRAADVKIEDIANSLSKICRYGAHLPRWYSVAEHSVHAFRKAKAEGHGPVVQLAALLHDAAEAYLGDVVKPLKCLIEPLYGPLEEANEAAVAEAFQVDFASTKDVWKRIDMELLIAERNAMFGKDGMQWTGEEEVEVFDLQVFCWSPEEAYRQFLLAFDELRPGVAVVPSRESILEEAARLTGGDRQESYGHPIKNFSHTAGLWNALFADKLADGKAFTPQDVPRAMICVKLSRQEQRSSRDCWTDIAGYAQTGHMCDEKSQPVR